MLKLRNFTIGKKIPDSVFTAANSQEQIMAIVQAMVGYVSTRGRWIRGLHALLTKIKVTFLNSILMPDPTEDSDSSSDDEETDDENVDEDE